MKKIIAIVIAVVVLLSVTVIAIHAVGSDNNELSETDTTATADVKTEPETMETASSEPVVTEPETTPPLETEPDVIEPIQLTTEQLFAGTWQPPTTNAPWVRFELDYMGGQPVHILAMGVSICYFSGEVIKNGDGYVGGDDFIFRWDGETPMTADATICFTDNDTFVIHIQNEENGIDFTWTYTRWNVAANPEIGRDFVTGTFKHAPGRFEEADRDHLAQVTFNDDMTMYFEIYSGEELVRVNGTYEIMRAGDNPLFAQKIADGRLKEDNYVALVEINEEDLGTVQMPTVSYYKLSTNGVVFNTLDDGERKIIGSYELKSFSFYRTGLEYYPA